MKIIMRLYKLHDLDLLYLYKMPSVSIQKIIKVVLKNYVHDRSDINGIQERVVIPRTPHEFPLPSSATLHIYLDDVDDVDIINWINQTPKGFRNAMIKNILRSYVDFPVTIPYETEVQFKATGHQNRGASISELNKKITKSKTPKTVKQQKPETVEKIVNTILDTDNKKEKEPSKPLEKKNIKSETANDVLGETKPKVSAKVSTEKTSESDDDDSKDLFDDFENMMSKV